MEGPKGNNVEGEGGVEQREFAESKESTGGPSKKLALFLPLPRIQLGHVWRAAFRILLLKLSIC